MQELLQVEGGAVKTAFRKLILAALAVFALAGLSGCMRISADELYSLPLASEEYLNLQSQINSVLSSGAELSPLTGGPNRQSVQIKDLNGDGNNEVIAFFSVPVEGTLKIYIFGRHESDYEVADIIEGVGAAIESVRYVDLDGDGVMELVVGWQMSAALQQMTIYSVRDFQHAQIADADYTTLAIFGAGGEGNDKVVAFRMISAESAAVAEVFELMPDGEVVSGEARLSSGLEKISRILPGKLSDGAPALFVESEGKYDNGGTGIVVDIFAYQDGVFKNVTAKLPDDISKETIRPVQPQAYSSDINKDGVMEVPVPRLLQAQSETSYYAIDWYAFNRYGAGALALTTYHNYRDGWYLILPFDWRGKVSIRREDAVSGERTLVFSHIGGRDGPYEDFLKIYMLYGDGRESLAALPGRTRLTAEGDYVYAFEILLGDTHGLTIKDTLIIENFKLIYSDWWTGAV